MTEITRMIVVWCRDWPVVALDQPAGQSVVVVRSNRVVATSPSARVAGVVEGQRRREAQRHSPDAVICERDIDREARMFDRVAAALDEITPRIEITRPGAAAFPARGPSRYFGGDEATAAKVRTAVSGLLPDPSGCGVGVADGQFAATLAAQRSLGRPGSPPMVVAPGASRSFLSPFPVGALSSPGPIEPETVDVFRRLGLRRLDDVADLDSSDLLARFGAEGLTAHRLASASAEPPAHLGKPPTDLTVSMELDPPAERVDQVAFAGKALADELHEQLERRGMACTRIAVTAHTTGGAIVERLWRHEGALSAVDIATRVRWQLDGWLSRPNAVQRGGVDRLVLTPDEVTAATGRQSGFWGGVTENDERARRGLSRVQALLGAESVRQPESRGGRAPAEEFEQVPIDIVGGEAPTDDEAPWPGSLPDPGPAVVLRRARPAELVDDTEQLVGVSGRGVLSGSPRRLSIDGGPWGQITAWAGPWLYDERWWDPVAHRRRARFQVVLADGAAHLVALEAGQWWIEASYD
jgi:protein ImuB